MAPGRAHDLAILDPGGPGRPFVWAHGLLSSCAGEDAAGLFPWSMIDGLRVVRFDARGHGASTGPPDPAAFEWPTLGADLVAVLDAVGLERSAVGGASMGCASAIYTALAAPTRVDRLVLVTPPTAWSTRAAQRDLYLAGAQVVEDAGIATMVELARQEPPLPVFGPAGDRLRGETLDRLIQMDARVLAHVLRGAAASDLPAPEELAAIVQPALVLAWADDAGHPVSTAEVLAAALPNAELHVAGDLAGIRSWPGLVGPFLR